MPELPEVEVLVRHLAPVMMGRRITSVLVLRPKVVRPDAPSTFGRRLRGATVRSITRRAKYLVFGLRSVGGGSERLLVGHLGMTGRMYVQPGGRPRPKHAAVVLGLDDDEFIFEDTRYFGRLTLDARVLDALGPEPLGPAFTPRGLAAALGRSQQAIKTRLLDQSVVAGVGNIYASEALFDARIHPARAAALLGAPAVRRLHRALRRVLARAIGWGSTVPLNWSGAGGSDGLFYYGRAAGAPQGSTERLRVYDRADEPCLRCGARVRRMVQGGRSTYYCPRCQSGV